MLNTNIKRNTKRPKNVPQIENPDDLQSIANNPGFFVYMTIFVYNGNNRKKTVSQPPSAKVDGL